MQSVQLLNNKTSGFKRPSVIDLNAPEYIHAGCLSERSDLLALYENHTGYINKDFPYIRIYDACSNNMAMFLHNHIHCRNSGLIIFKYNTGTHENEHHEKASKHENILYSCTQVCCSNKSQRRSQGSHKRKGNLCVDIFNNIQVYLLNVLKLLMIT